MVENLEQAAGMFKVLSDPTRLKIVKLLAESGALAARLGVTQGAVSQHLRVLRQTGLAKGDRYGFNVHYALSPGVLETYRELMRGVLGDGK